MDVLFITPPLIALVACYAFPGGILHAGFLPLQFSPYIRNCHCRISVYNIDNHL